QEDLVPPLTTAALYHTRPDGTIDFRGELRRLSAELLFGFLELIKTLVEQPDRYAQQLTSVNVLLSNLVHLTSALRPHQARATLEATLALQVGAMREGVGRLRAQAAAADAALAGLAAALAEAGAAEGDTAESAARPAAAEGAGAQGEGPGAAAGAAAMEVEG
ncbi:hypothetical protein HYH03_012787, partial [Edaphochlamys debaryana]